MCWGRSRASGWAELVTEGGGRAFWGTKVGRTALGQRGDVERLCRLQEGEVDRRGLTRDDDEGSCPAALANDHGSK